MKYIIILCLLLTGCSFSRQMQMTVSAKGVKKLDARLEKGDVLYESETSINLFCKEKK